MGQPEHPPAEELAAAPNVAPAAGEPGDADDQRRQRLERTLTMFSGVLSQLRRLKGKHP